MGRAQGHPKYTTVALYRFAGGWLRDDDYFMLFFSFCTKI